MDAEETEFMDEVLSLPLICVVTEVSHAVAMRARRPKGRLWEKRHLGYEQRLRYSPYFNLLREAALHDTVLYFKYTRMTPTVFEELCTLVGPSIFHQDSRFRKSISIGERISLTIRFLATGESLQSLSYSYRVGHSTAYKIVGDVCRELFAVLAPQVLELPSRPEQWLALERDFNRLWDFPHCIGAIDGKHVRITAPEDTGSLYFNYKGYFSIILLGLCDARYRFTYVDIGAPGRESDAGIYAASNFSTWITNARTGTIPHLNFPPPSPMPFSHRVLPYVIVGDEAFPLEENLTRPYPGRGRGGLSLLEKIFNYRLSRARRIIENAFGILVARWRIFKTEIFASPERAQLYTQAAVILHNFLIGKRLQNYAPPTLTDRWCAATRTWIEGEWRAERPMDNIGNKEAGKKKAKKDAWNYRDQFALFFKNEGAVPWQVDRVTYAGPRV